MATPAFSNFAKAIARVKSRSGNAFVFDSTQTPTYAALGRVKNISIGFEPVSIDADTTGREMMVAANITIALTLTQTSDNELANLSLLADPASEGSADWANGLTVAITDAPTDAATLDGGGFSGEEFKFNNCLPMLTMNLDFDGETEGVIEVEITGRVKTSKLKEFGNTKEISFDAA